ncbi:MAG: GLUG motif-containing protein [Paludibacteraceae bacterium]|nr:GLUG motif-containing protein [Paludibacteraceae bacterium]
MKRFIITSITLNILSFHSHCANWDGAGTEDDPFRISTSQQLAELAEEVNNGTDFYNEFFCLTNDIDLSEICDDSLGSWTPIGSIFYYFEGTLLGNNHTISHLYIDIDDNRSYYGLFGYIGEHGAVYDLTIENGSVYSTFWSGAIAAANSGLISNCKNIDCVIDSWHYSGGICGVNFNTIKDCSNQAEVTSSFCSGGICAYNYGTITDCTNDHNITANEGGGGICGYNGGFANFTNCHNLRIGFIDNCINSSIIIGDKKIGGIAGRNDGFIVNAMNSGEINGDQQVGGLVGYNGGFDDVVGSISNSYNRGHVIGLDTLTGGIIGYGNQASEIYNVYTNDNIHCVNTSTTQYIGEEIGHDENNFVVYQYRDSTCLDSIVDQLNQWISIQQDQDSYHKWEIKDNNICTIKEDTTFINDENYPDTTNIDINETKIFCGKGYLYIISPIRQSIYVYTIDGKNVLTTNLIANALTRIQLNKGIYIVNGQKVVVF